MTKDEAIRRLCALVTRVGDKRFGSAEEHDCFCRHDPSPVISEDVIAFIERATDYLLADYEVGS